MKPGPLTSAAGLRVLANANGALRRIDYDDVTLNLFPASELEGGPANVWLRLRGGDAIEAVPLLGPQSPLSITTNREALRGEGAWGGLRVTLDLRLAATVPAWFWHVGVENLSSAPATFDLVHAQDFGLAHWGALRNNEYYLSQYVDYAPLDHPRNGVVLAVRQNLPMGGKHPWALLGSLGRAVSFATDALQLYRVGARATGRPAALADERLPGARLQHEHSLAVLQEAPTRLGPGESAALGFFGRFKTDHPEASSAADLDLAEESLALPEALPPAACAASGNAARPPATLFSARPLLAVQDLSERDAATLFGEARRHEERDGSALLSFFAGPDRHVVLRRKELGSLRQHGHILRTGGALAPDEAALSTTAWMNGTFNSLLTQGHCNINRFLSTARGYLGLFRAHGQRIFVELDDGYYLLDMPSAFEMAPSACRWIYRHGGGAIEVRVCAPVDRHEIDLAIRVLAGPPRRFLVSHHVALAGDDADERVPVSFEADSDGVTVFPPPDSDIGRRFPTGSFRIDAAAGTVIERVTDDASLFLDGLSRGEPYLALVIAPAREALLRLRGCLLDAGPVLATALPAAGAAGAHVADDFWRTMTARTVITAAPAADAGAGPHAERLVEILPWLAHNALIHYLAPHGLEQYSNGGWGTRDVSQGPVELFLALERYDETRDLLLRVFSAQNPDGDWPQWFMFFDRERGIRAPDSHGDIVFWPVLALAQYLLASDDSSILDERLPFFDPHGDAHGERAAMATHVERALAVIARRVIPGTSLAAYGHGDWNDSLQPADPSMAERLCSAWTVTLHRQTLTTLAAALGGVGRSELAGRLLQQAERVLADFHRLLVADGVLGGFAYFHADGRIERFLHPSDDATGIRYRLLPMIHAIINDMLSPDQARDHVEIMRDHLIAPDGARLFDRPPVYRGGPQRHFRRAESSSFFGREIGVMYVHAHLRYAEAMARYGAAEAFFTALKQMNPILLGETVPSAAPRQANCYHSSSDAVFSDRYEAGARYGDVRAGRVAFEGGWRVYSSGAGIASRLIRQCLLGLRATRSLLVIDPVLVKGLDGLRIETDLLGARFSVSYAVESRGVGPVAIALNGRAMEFEREPNPYRSGGASLLVANVRAHLVDGVNRLDVRVG